MGADLVSIRRQAAGPWPYSGKHGTQVIRSHLPDEAEVGGRTAKPLAVRFACAGVVVVERLGDTRELVGLLADTELCDRQHRPDNGHRGAPSG